MHTRMSTYTSPQRQRWLLRAMLALGIAFFSMIGIVKSTPVAYASGIPGGNVADPLVRAVDIAKPAVVRIYTQLNSQLTVHFSLTQSVTFPQGGGNYILTFSGSGTFISAHGDILTVDHVVNPPHDQQLSQPLDMQAAQDVANYINQNLKPNPPVTQDQVKQELTSGQLSSDPIYGTPASEVFLSTDYTGPLTATDINSVPAQFRAPIDHIEAESVVNAKDVAIVHVNINDVASVQLGDSSSVQQQDMLTIIGFPSNGDVSNLPTNLLSSSVNQIIVSSIKTTNQGTQVIQVGGNVEHGDSGGPALDSNGNVVGIVSFGLSEQGNTSFLQASNSARDLVQSLHLDTTPGPFEKAWSQAFNDYAANTPGHWHKAQQELGAIHTNYPQFNAIQPYLEYAQVQAQKENVSQLPPPVVPSSQPQVTTSSSLVWIILSAAVVIALALALFVLTLMLRRRGNKGPVQSPLSTTIPQQSTRPPQVMQTPSQTDGMTAFGAPATPLQPGQWPVQPQPSSTLSGVPIATAGASGGLRPWPCGHMNRPNARYCTICGEPAPPPTIRRIEQ